MDVKIGADKTDMGRQAGTMAAETLRTAIAARGEAFLIVATGASQFEMLAHLVTEDVDWSKVTGFHLDEYVGLPESHPASFRKYLRERFVEKVDGLRAFHYVDGDAADPAAECERLNGLIRPCVVDVACVGIGENAHLAFNDPPADFETETPYLVVTLDEACRRQQMGEGWFPTLGDAPEKAISMSVRQILKSRRIVCTVPDERKAEAVRLTLEEPVRNTAPASILREHGDCHLFLDPPSASRLSAKPE